MRYIRTRGNGVDEAPATPFWGNSWYLANGYIAYSGTLPGDRLSIADGAVVELEAPETTPTATRVFSKLKLRDNLATLGLWHMLKNAIESDESIAERWALAQDISENDADFVTLKKQLETQFDTAETTLDDFLNTCQKER